ncbi:metabotropic glutamate receptor-like [Pomacea canaliculata]|uniref:metabotropic glutamate receptor-like n=1 Tax=Pomacea canaliculata TaxID=400727 RepID=UPI000D734C3E|nr:metabotropic glutamate receptor-like [Pomacea canaliculata]
MFTLDAVLLAFTLSFIVDLQSRLLASCFVVSGLPEKKFAHLGDVNIGLLMPLSHYNSAEMACSHQMLDPSYVHLSQIVEYAVGVWNSRGLLPNNLTFGFVVLDDCGDVNIAAAQALTFVPQTSCRTAANGEVSSDVTESYDVVAVIGSATSSQSKAVSHLLGPARVPQVSFFSTSDELSDKALFPYFVRTVPPDRFQFQAIFRLMQQFGWSYVSVVYTEGSYGENGFRQLQNLFEKHGICLGAAMKIAMVMTDLQAQEVALKLVENRNARVVVLITSREHAHSIIAATSDLEAAGHFIWVASDAWASAATAMGDLGPAMWGTVTVSPFGSSVPEYHEYFLNLTPKDTRNPWFEEFWEGFFNCSLHNGTCSANQTLHARKGELSYSRILGYVVDTIAVIANATARVLMSPACAGLAGRQARTCVTGTRLLSEVKVTHEQGLTGWLELEDNGDRLGSYVVSQVLPLHAAVPGALTSKVVSTFDAHSKTFTEVSDVDWRYHTRLQEESNRLNWSLFPPESRCSWPCSIGEARIPQEVTCCWLCRPCRPNEHLVLNGTMCQTCPTFTWPDPATGYSTCYDISPDTPTFASLRGVLQTLAALACCALCLAVLVFFVRHWNCRIIKACSRELSLLMLLAIGLGYVTMVTLLAPPSEVSCRINYLLFCLSFAVIYGSLLVRAQRIYRIFDAGQRSTQRPRLIGSSHQLLFAAGLILVQVLICSLIMSEYGPWHRRFMAVAMEAYVEVSCEVPAVGLYSFLVYNLLQVAVCSLLAFKTRRLPDNFNESRFISMCVSTTLVIWLAFVPAYMVSGREHLRLLMLALALALNHSVALVFLFLPKVYAVLYLQDAADVTATAMTRAGVTMTLARHAQHLSSVTAVVRRTVTTT